ncbi:hypothetical protein Taro_053498, partial [Colocasia esculenta]|nr:hypothetical protein [Colocasia esculenta]
NLRTTQDKPTLQPQEGGRGEGREPTTRERERERERVAASIEGEEGKESTRGGGWGRERAMAGLRRANPPPENAVVVAVRAEREISKTTLAWALTHVVRPGDFVTLLAVICNHDKDQRRRLWSFPKFAGDCGNGRRSGSPENCRKCEVSASCSQMALQFQGFQDHSEVNMRIKVVVSTAAPSVAAGGGSTVVAESKRVGANWIVLDKQLKQEAKQCMQELPHCSIVLMKNSDAKILRLNLGGAAPIYKPHPAVPTFTLVAPSRPEHRGENQRRDHEEEEEDKGGGGRASRGRAKHCTPTGSPEEHHKASSARDTRVSTSSSSTNGSSSPFFVVCNAISKSKEEGSAPLIQPNPWWGFCRTEDHRDPSSPRDVRRLQQPISNPNEAPLPAAHNNEHAYKMLVPSSTMSPPPIVTKTLQDKFVESDRKSMAGWDGVCHTVDAGDVAYKSNVRDAVLLLGNSPCVPPPLCSICRHKSPVFGKPPRWFNYGELEEATAGFSEANFLAEGGFASVHRGVLPNGQVVAVKRLKGTGGPKADDEFRAEVEVLSRAQHRNVVMLVGFCVEETRRELVYEYICNGSLAAHLYGGKLPPLDWHARFRIAVGSARGLRYLHEDCRVGFIHGDVRPSNILLTHDFEALVGDFGLARWQVDGNGVDTRVVANFGYLAPEYIESGVITEKADVYAFGVVLLELVTGRRAMDMRQPKGQQFLAEWARPVLALASEGDRTIAVDRLLDPRLDQEQTRRFADQLNAVAHAASLCLRREPESRPSMSKVLRVLEGDTVVNQGLISGNQKGSRSGRFINPLLKRYAGSKGSLSQRIPHEAVSRALHADLDI